MKRYSAPRKIFLFVVATTFIFAAIFAGSQVSQHFKTAAQELSCPPGMSDTQCLAYLQQQANKITAEKDKMLARLNQEEINALSLQGQINYYNNLIAQSNTKINELQLQIETNNVEIRILGKEIDELNNNISTSSSEVERLRNNLRKRIAVSYKYSSESSLQILMSTSSLDSISRKIKYLQKSKERDEFLLSTMSEEIEKLSQDKATLDDKIAQTEQKQEEIEESKKEIEAERETLAANKVEQDKLLAESRKKQQEYEATLTSLKAQEAAAGAYITRFIMERFNSGELPANIPVNRGDIIGFQGHTGYSYASHLHLVVMQNSVAVNPFASGYFSGGGLYQSVGTAGAHYPLDGGVLTQTGHGFYPMHQAIDLQSTSAGDQSGSYYYRDYTVTCNGLPLSPIPPGYISLRGEGAPIRAIKSGMISAMYTDVCGGKYRIVDHGNGETSLYLHMR